MSFAAFAQGQPSTQQAHASLHLGMEISGDILGQHYTTYVLPSDITNSPAWPVAKGGEPPVSMQEAIKSAKEALSRTITDSSCWSLGGIEMEEWPGSERDYAPGKGHWFYKIDWAGPSQSKMTMVVLMNGRALCPQKQEKAKADMAGGTSMGFFGSINGHQYSTYVRDSDVADTPIWSASGEKPPVSAGEAAKLARSALSKALGDTSSWNLSNVILKEWPGSGHWIYTVEFDGPSYRVPNVQGSFGSEFTIVVLMNGNALAPKPEKTN